MLVKQVNVLFCLVLVTVVALCSASSGDSTQFFQYCCINCERQNCTEDGLGIQEQAISYYKQSIFDRAFLWTCADECQYGCMWRTVNAFLERNLEVPQFYGKWPFIRFLGLQEPASVLFSILNFFMHIRCLRKFRRDVKSDSPCYALWHIFAFVCLNGWLWSAVFHTRDFPITELLDYAFANSIILSMFYCMVLRMLYDTPRVLRGLISLVFLFYFLNYFAYLAVGKFSYSLNMRINLLIGVTTKFGWSIWCYKVSETRPYYKKLLRFYVLFGIALLFELLDFPPILWIIDAHALWHFSTVIIVPMFYSFVIDDCNALRKEKLWASQQLKKET